MNLPDIHYSSLAALIDDAEKLYRDVRLHAVKSWKEATGRKAVGYMPVWVPGL